MNLHDIDHAPERVYTATKARQCRWAFELSLSTIALIVIFWAATAQMAGIN